MGRMASPCNCSSSRRCRRRASNCTRRSSTWPAGRLVATRLGHRRDVGLGGRLAPVAAADAEQGGAADDLGRAEGLSARSPSVYGFWLRSFAIRAKAFRRRTIRTRRMAASRSAMPPLIVSDKTETEVPFTVIVTLADTSGLKGV